MMKRIAVAALALLWAMASVEAQVVYQAPWGQVGTTVTLSASTTSSNVQLGWVGAATTPPAPPSVWIHNGSSTIDVYVVLGGSGVVATSAGILIAAGSDVLIALNGAQYLAGITASSTATLSISAGIGSPLAKGGGGGGGGAGMNVTGSNATAAALQALATAAGSASFTTGGTITGTAVKGTSLIDTGITAGQVLLGGGAGALTGIAEVDGDCVVGSVGAWTAGPCTDKTLTLIIGTTSVTGTNGNVLYNNAGTLGGLSPSTTVNGQTCTLGSTCTITAAATSIVPGTTTIPSGGTDKGLLYDNAGTLGNLATANSGVLVTSGAGVPSISSTLPSGIAATNMALTTPSLDVASGTSVTLTGAAPQLTLGVNTTTLGAFKMFGSTSGDLTLNPPAVAGTASKITLPAGITDFSGTGGASQFVSQASAGAPFTVVRPACAALSDSGTGCTATIANYAALASPTFSGTQTMTTVVGGGRIVSGTSDTASATDCGDTIHFTSGSALTMRSCGLTRDANCTEIRWTASGECP